MRREALGIARASGRPLSIADRELAADHHRMAAQRRGIPESSGKFRKTLAMASESFARQIACTGNEPGKQKHRQGRDSTMNIIASDAAATLSHGLGKSLSITILAAGLIGAAASPSLAEGDYVAGPTASPAWTQAASRTPLAGAAPIRMHRLAGGDDQYVAGPTAFGAAPQAASRTPLSASGMNRGHFDLASQGG
jgi:hypothetical protein